MIKRINSQQLKPGMFVHDLNCGWMDHPFAFNSFKVDDEKTIEKIIACGIREFYIDTSKGLDVTDAQTQDEFRTELHEKITSLVESHVTTPPPPTSLHEEIHQARAILKESHKVVRHLMSDIRIGKKIDLEKMSPIVEDVTDSIFRSKDAFISLSRIKNKDEYTFQHSVSVCALLVAFCLALKYKKEDILEAGLGGLLHDVGKMKIPNHILNKPASLNQSELVSMRSHASIGRELLEQTPGIPETAIIITGQHHERYDGTGYPDRIKQDEISQFGKMAAIVDVYDALTSDRIYHKGIEPTAALKKIFEWSRFHFDADLVQRFICLIGIYPVGSLVRLQSGMLGIVVNPGNENLLRPTVRTVFDIRRERSVTPRDVDLSINVADSIVRHESPHLWGLTHSRGINPFSYL